MGIVFDRKFIYFESPRTGSNAVRNALLGRGPGNTSAVWPEFTMIAQHISRPEMGLSFLGMPGVCNIRNPFDVLASWFFHHKSFKSIRHMIHNNKAPDFMKEGRVLYHAPHCNFLIRYGENMLPSLNDILNHFKCRPVKEIRQENVTRDRPPYQRAYTQADIDAVRDLIQPELDELNYYFEGEPLG
jgi:hypothetical protein